MKTEITKNDLVIQGVLKEAYFSDSVFVIEGSECYIRIIDIIENKIRDSSANKKIYTLELRVQ